METFAKRIAVILVSLFLLIYVCYQAFQAFYDPIKTETVMERSMYETINVPVVAVRNETVIEGSLDSFLSYSVQNGERVSRDGVIAEVYSSKEDSMKQDEIDKIDEELRIIGDVESQTNMPSTGIYSLDSNIWHNIHNLTDISSNSRFLELGGVKRELLKYMNKRQITVGKTVDFSARKEELRSMKASLEAGYSKSSEKIISPMPGYFVNGSDGYERTLTNAEIDDLTPDKVKTFIEENKPLQYGSIGKVVGEFEWYLACVVPINDTIELGVGIEYEIVLPFVSDSAIPATLHKKEVSGDKEVLLVFKCDYMSKELSSVRVATAQIRIRKYTGLQVLSSRVLSNDAGEMGVYCLVGDTVKFKKINILYPSREYIVCATENEGSGYLKLYDEIVVEGSGLYDGKTIKT